MLILCIFKHSRHVCLCLFVRNRVVFTGVTLMYIKSVKQKRTWLSQLASLHLSVVVGVKCQYYITHKPLSFLWNEDALALNIQSVTTFQFHTATIQSIFHYKIIILLLEDHLIIFLLFHWTFSNYTRIHNKTAPIPTSKELKVNPNNFPLIEAETKHFLSNNLFSYILKTFFIRKYTSYLNIVIFPHQIYRC